MTSANTATTTERQAQHIRAVLKMTQGDTLSVGLLNGKMGRAVIGQTSDSGITLHDIQLDQNPPAGLPMTLILGMPRPQMIKRILQTVATMGVEHLVLLQTSRVEKSFWQSPSATDQAIHEQLLLGLEQGVATQLPKVSKFQRFRPFVEDHLEELCAGSKCYIADPSGDDAPEIHAQNERITLAIGPEGGFLNQEVSQFQQRGFQNIHLGQRILKVETAVPVLLAKLYTFSKV